MKVSNQRFIRKFNNITFISMHPVLDDICRQIIMSIDGTFKTKKKIIIYFGIHKKISLYDFIFRKGFKIGVQTEQFYDANGNALWALTEKNIKHTSTNCKRVNLILDLSYNNKKFYPTKASSKIVFGPYIFPKKNYNFKPGNNEKSIFVGYIKGQNRTNKIKKYKDNIETLDKNLFGTDLSNKISPFKSMTNIHFQEGIYTEYPRILLSILEGKVLYSDKLSSEFIESKHYLNIDNITDNNNDLVHKEIFNNLKELTSVKYNFEDFILRVSE